MCQQIIITFYLTFQCELFHWADVLDKFDDVLGTACHKEKEGQWTLPCDVQGNEKVCCISQNFQELKF